MCNPQRMLNIYDYFQVPEPSDEAGRSASAGWMDLMSADGRLLGGTDLRAAYIDNKAFQKKNARLSKTFAVFPRTQFGAADVDKVGRELASFICPTGIDAAAVQVLGDAILEIMQNCVDHSAEPGMGRGTVSSARAGYGVTVFIQDTGRGFTSNYAETLALADPACCPADRHDATAIDLAVTRRCTTARGAVADNLGNGLPNFLTAADQAIIVSGSGRFIHQSPDALFRDDVQIPNGMAEDGRASMAEHYYQGVAIEGYFNLRRTGGRLDAAPETGLDDVYDHLRKLLCRDEAVLHVRRR